MNNPNQIYRGFMLKKSFLLMTVFLSLLSFTLAGGQYPPKNCASNGALVDPPEITDVYCGCLCFEEGGTHQAWYGSSERDEFSCRPGQPVNTYCYPYYKIREKSVMSPTVTATPTPSPTPK